jgi:hypothetical protein
VVSMLGGGGGGGGVTVVDASRLATHLSWNAKDADSLYYPWLQDYCP